MNASALLPTWPAWLRVGLYAMVTALATGLGALPFLCTRTMSRRAVGLAAGLAGGIMLAASFRLVREGVEIGLFRALGGALAGFAFIALTQKLIKRRGSVGIANLEGAGAAQALLIFGVMTLHSFAEGVGVGVSFGGGQDFGLFVAGAIAVHNIPEGLSISLVLIPKGTPIWKAAALSIVSSLPQPLLAVPSFLFVETVRPVLPVGLGIAGGAMVWMVVAELLPEAFENAKKEQVAAMTVFGVVGMVAFQQLVGV